IYTLQKNTKYESFYDAYDKYLLGFREINKDFNIIERTNAKILVNYSLKNIKDFYPEMYGFTNEELENFKKKFKMNDLLNKIAQRRCNIIKKLGAEIN